MGKGFLVSLFRFHSQKLTSKRRFSSVSLVTIPALTIIVDRQFREDRTLCLVRALRYFLDRTKDLRGSRSLLSFKKGHTSDIRPATLFLAKISYLVINTQINSIGLGPSQSITLEPSWPLRPFLRWGIGGPNHACQWKAHTLFYLKDLTWSDNNNMYLGPVVVAQQVQDPSPQHPHLRDEKKGGTPAATKSSGVYPRV